MNSPLTPSPTQQISCANVLDIAKIIEYDIDTWQVIKNVIGNSDVGISIASVVGIGNNINGLTIFDGMYRKSKYYLPKKQLFLNNFYTLFLRKKNIYSLFVYVLNKQPRKHLSEIATKIQQFGWSS